VTFTFTDKIEDEWDGKLPSDITPDIPKLYQDFLVKYSLKDWNNIYFSPKMKRLIFPIRKPDGELVGYQARFIGLSQPKWITKCKKFPWGKKYPYVVNRPSSEYIVLVEDIISAIKVGQNNSAIALLGCSINDDLRTFLFKRGHKFIIWMDGDEAGQKGRQKIQNSLRLSCDVKHIETEHDPKFYSNDRIKELINESLNENN
jgi:DNA primase